VPFIRIGGRGNGPLVRALEVFDGLRLNTVFSKGRPLRITFGFEKPEVKYQS
jgi:hypothetical protein